MIIKMSLIPSLIGTVLRSHAGENHLKGDSIAVLISSSIPGSMEKQLQHPWAN
jgi:hypothetical protein